MNVFEDLIVELKEENLLENTVIDPKKDENARDDFDEKVELANDYDPEAPDTSARDDQEIVAEEEESGPIAKQEAAEVELVNGVSEDDIPVELRKPKTPKPKAGKEFFKKRAVDEVASLQMVEHILTGVEREYMKVVPKPFDDFNAKKALHTFVNIAENSNSEEHKAAEFALMQETEAWSLALLERDRNIQVSSIRLYCENSRPALSSQALLAVARFYRNAPYSEAVRAKFDFVITRLFSRAVGSDKRICLFGRDEILTHINTLYSDWSSVPLYDADGDDSNLLLTSLSFDDLAAQAENASHFDQLIESDFFGRLRLFKESISELFYAPVVTSSAIESNIRIGNAYVKLLVRERQKLDAASIQLKYGEVNDNSVSDAAGCTLDLADLLNNLSEEALRVEEPVTAEEADAPVEVLNFDAPKQEVTTVKRPPFLTGLIHGIRHINKWIIVVGFVGILISGCLYVLSSGMGDEKVSTAGVTAVDLDGVLSEHIKIGKISDNVFYAVLLPSWDNLPKEKREEYLGKVLKLGLEKGYKAVILKTKEGKQAGYANATKIEVYMP
jgi:hypothetical protein